MKLTKTDLIQSFPSGYFTPAPLEHTYGFRYTLWFHNKLVEIIYEIS